MPHGAVSFTAANQGMVPKGVEHVPTAWAAGVAGSDSQAEAPLNSNLEEGRLQLPPIVGGRGCQPRPCPWQ